MVVGVLGVALAKLVVVADVVARQRPHRGRGHTSRGRGRVAPTCLKRDHPALSQARQTWHLGARSRRAARHCLAVAAAAVGATCARALAAQHRSRASAAVAATKSKVQQRPPRRKPRKGHTVLHLFDLPALLNPWAHQRRHHRRRQQIKTNSCLQVGNDVCRDVQGRLTMRTLRCVSHNGNHHRCCGTRLWRRQALCNDCLAPQIRGSLHYIRDVHIPIHIYV